MRQGKISSMMLIVSQSDFVSTATRTFGQKWGEKESREMLLWTFQLLECVYIWAISVLMHGYKVMIRTGIYLGFGNPCSQCKVLTGYCINVNVLCSRMFYFCK